MVAYVDLRQARRRARDKEAQTAMSEATQSQVAMQYSFTLPADYDMAIVERRIAEKGPALDGWPGLRAKGYLSARRDANQRENLYAPFYLWDDAAAMNGFLTGRGFAGVSDAFGWPKVQVWIVWRARLAADIAQAKFATREIAPIAPYALLGALEAQENEAADAAMTHGALAAVAGFEPTSWTHMRFRLWRDRPAPGAGAALYDVGHVSLGAPRARGGKGFIERPRGRRRGGPRRQGDDID